MVTIGALWLPILLSSIAVWVASALVWTVMPHHKSDWAKLPDEDAARRALIPQGLVPGLYSIPYAVTHKDLEDPETTRKFEERRFVPELVEERRGVRDGPRVSRAGRWNGASEQQAHIAHLVDGGVRRDHGDVECQAVLDGVGRDRVATCRQRKDAKGQGSRFHTMVHFPTLPVLLECRTNASDHPFQPA